MAENKKAFSKSPTVEKRGKNSYRITFYGGVDKYGQGILHRKTVHVQSQQENERRQELQEAIQAFRRELSTGQNDVGVCLDTDRKKKRPKPVIEKRGKESYRITIVYGKDFNGKNIVHRRTVHISETNQRRIKDALDEEILEFTKELEEAWENGVPLELSIDVKLKDFIKREWLPYCSMMNHVSERGVEDYARIAEKRIIPVIGSKRMVDVRIQDIERIYIQMLAAGLSGTTCRRVHEVLRSIYNRAVQIGLLTPEKNPINRVKPPRIDKAYKYKVFTEEQAKRFIQALHMEYPITCPAHTRKNQNGTEYEVKAYKFPKPVTISTMFQAFFILALYTGCRRGELCGLNWDDIDFKKRTLRINKSLARTNASGHFLKDPKTTAGDRMLTLPSECLSILAKWREEAINYAIEAGSNWCGSPISEFDSGPVFYKRETEPGSRMSLDLPGKKFREVITLYNSQCENEKDKLPYIRLHDLRHTNASILLANNVDLATVAHRLGHEKITTTLAIYTHFLPLKDQEAVNLLDSILT